MIIKKLAKFSAVFSGFFVLMFLFMVPEWGQTVFSGAPLDSTTRDVSKFWENAGDYGFYFGAAYSWHSDGILVNPAWQWVTNIWPPGMVFLNLFTISLVGVEGKFILALVCFTVFIWSFVFSCGFYICKSYSQRVVFLAGVVAMFLTTPFTVYIASDSFALPTGFALAFSLLGLMMLGKLEPITVLSQSLSGFRESVSLSLVAGTVFAVAALFRVTSLFAVYGAIGVIVILFGLTVIRKVISRDRGDNQKVLIRNRQNNRFVFRLLLVSVVPIFLTLYWTQEVTTKAHPDNFSYTVSVPELASYVWRPDSQLIEIGAPWLIESSANWACRIDKETCLKIVQAEASSPRPWAGVGKYSSSDYERLAIVSAFKNPVGYVFDRAPKAWRNWSSGNAAQGVFFLVASVAAILLAVSRTVRQRDVQAFFFLTMVFFATAPMLRVLIFYYYFIPIQIGSVFYLLINQDAARHFFSDILHKYAKCNNVDTNRVLTVNPQFSLHGKDETKPDDGLIDRPTEQ